MYLNICAKFQPVCSTPNVLTRHPSAVYMRHWTVSSSGYIMAQCHNSDAIYEYYIHFFSFQPERLNAMFMEYCRTNYFIFYIKYYLKGNIIGQTFQFTCWSTDWLRPSQIKHHCPALFVSCVGKMTEIFNRKPCFANRYNKGCSLSLWWSNHESSICPLGQGIESKLVQKEDNSHI